MIDIVRRAIVDEYRPQSFTFSRNSLAYDDCGRLYYPHQLRYVLVDGRTGVLVEEGVSNLLSAEDSQDLTRWVQIRAAVRAVSWPELSVPAYEIEVTDTSFNVEVRTSTRVGLVQGRTFTFAILVKGVVESGWRLRITHTGADWSNDVTYANIPPGTYNTPTLFSVTRTMVDPDDTSMSIAIENTSRVLGRKIQVALPRLYEKAYPLSWHIGGTTRAAETLTVPTSVIDLNRGTAELWVYLQAFHSLKNFAFLDGRTDNNSIVLVMRATASGLNFAFGTGGHTLPWGSVTVPGWAYMAVRWDNGTWAAFYNGSKLFEFTYTPNQPLSGLCVGKHGLFGADYANTVIGPLRISRRARTDQEIADAYAAGTLTADADTTLLLDFSKGPYVRRAAKVIRAI